MLKLLLPALLLACLPQAAERHKVLEHPIELASAPEAFLKLSESLKLADPMRASFSEEKRTGTLELLLTRPLTELQLVLAKYTASLVLVLVALIPTLVYYWSVKQLAVPVGNVDSGGTWGSYLGLLFLAGCFTGIGLFASAITESQIVAFLIAVFLCFVLYQGFGLVASFDLLGALEGPIKAVGMEEHYRSMSRGVIDLRDVAYFMGVTAVFVLLTRTVLQSRKW